MKRFKKILVYCGGSNEDNPALWRAMELAKSNSASVELLDVIEELPTYARLLTPSTWDIAGMITGDRERALETTACGLREQGIDVTTSVLVGKPAAAITHHVLTEGHDLVLKTARPEEVSPRLWYGTLAKRLMRICPCPVWIIQRDQAQRFERIAVAVDPDENDEENVRLNIKLLELASSLARREGGELRIVHAWSAYGASMLEKRMSPDKFERYIGEHRVAARQRVEKLLAEFADHDAAERVRLLRGDPKHVLVDFVAQEGIDLVVMGTVCRSGVTGYVIGNTAENVLSHIGTSVLAVKPDGFQSPIAAQLPEYAATQDQV